tara:strand:- start:167 stop:382 length:216 start_codon:yes stop_codon:yes gene_type:complete
MPRRRFTPVQVSRSWAARCTQRVLRSRWHGGKFYAMHWGYKMDNQQGGGNAGCARPAGAADYAWTAFAGSE